MDAERLLLLSSAAVYRIAFSRAEGRMTRYKRIPLGSIVEIVHGQLFNGAGAEEFEGLRLVLKKKSNANTFRVRPLFALSLTVLLFLME